MTNHKKPQIGTENSEAEITKNQQPKRDLRIAKILFTLISLVICSLGLLAVLTQHYYGYTNKYGVHELNIDGISAIKIGIGYIVFGLFPLAVWAKTAKGLVIWMACTIVLGLYCMLFW